MRLRAWCIEGVEEELIPLTVPEVRRLLCRLVWGLLPAPRFVLHWSVWRRKHQAIAQRCHWQRRAKPG